MLEVVFFFLNIVRDRDRGTGFASLGEKKKSKSTRNACSLLQHADKARTQQNNATFPFYEILLDGRFVLLLFLVSSISYFAFCLYLSCTDTHNRNLPILSHLIACSKWKYTFSLFHVRFCFRASPGFCFLVDYFFQHFPRLSVPTSGYTKKIGEIRRYEKDHQRRGVSTRQK